MNTKASNDAHTQLSNGYGSSTVKLKYNAQSKNFSLFQQIYWDTTCRVGCGQAECGGGSNRIKVCAYAVGWDKSSSSSNYVPACASCPNTCSNNLCGKYELFMSYYTSMIMLSIVLKSGIFSSNTQLVYSLGCKAVSTWKGYCFS